MQVVLGHLSCEFERWRPTDGRVFDSFAYDTETTDIDEDRPYLTPAYVVGAACDGRRGVVLGREDVLPFFEAHRGATVIMHNAAFDLKVTAPLVTPTIDVYEWVDRDRVWDTLGLKRLLSLATAGHTARGEASLESCALTHLGVRLRKQLLDAEGRSVRLGFGQFLGKPPEALPAEYRQYLGEDAMATWHLFAELHRLIKGVLANSRGVWGYVNRHPGRVWGQSSDDWLREVVRRFGPLTHHVQLKASILMDALTANGVGTDQAPREEKRRRVEEVLEATRERLRKRGYLVGEKGNAKSLQSILDQFHREHPDVELSRTPSGEKWSTAEEHLAELSHEDAFFMDYVKYRAAEKLLSTYLSKMGKSRLHPSFGYLLATGRTYCGGGFNLQNLPNEKDLTKDDPEAATIRGCFVPGEGCVFIDSDYGQIELVVFGSAAEKQFGWRSELARLINEGNDIHRLIAATVMGKGPGEVTKPERDSAKPVSFGRLGAMGVRGLRRVAKNSYGIDLSVEEVKGRIEAYHRLCPELDLFLQDEVDTGEVIAGVLHLTPAQYYDAVGKYYNPSDPDNVAPAGWLGGMLLKVLRDESPATDRGLGRPYTADEIAFFWSRAQHLDELLGRLPRPLRTKVREQLARRQPGEPLWEAVRKEAGRRPVFTVTGRLRANATFGSSRNNIFQGGAADGAVLGLWLVWRAGYKIVAFIHDQLVVESPADDRVDERVAHIESLMKQGMALVAPGMLVKVETVVTASLSKQDLDPRYDPKPKSESIPITAPWAEVPARPESRPRSPTRGVRPPRRRRLGQHLRRGSRPGTSRL